MLAFERAIAHSVNCFVLFYSNFEILQIVQFFYTKFEKKIWLKMYP